VLCWATARTATRRTHSWPPPRPAVLPRLRRPRPRRRPHRPRGSPSPRRTFGDVHRIATNITKPQCEHGLGATGIPRNTTSTARVQLGAMPAVSRHTANGLASPAICEVDPGIGASIQPIASGRNPVPCSNAHSTSATAGLGVRARFSWLSAKITAPRGDLGAPTASVQAVSA
jgi:hypothetical protein